MARSHVAVIVVARAAVGGCCGGCVRQVGHARHLSAQKAQGSVAVRSRSSNLCGGIQRTALRAQATVPPAVATATTSAAAASTTTYPATTTTMTTCAAATSSEGSSFNMAKGTSRSNTMVACSEVSLIQHFYTAWPANFECVTRAADAIRSATAAARPATGAPRPLRLAHVCRSKLESSGPPLHTRQMVHVA